MSIRIEDEHVPLARMLYRAGAWMSHMDYDGGDASHQREHGVIFTTLERMKSDPTAKSLSAALFVATKAKDLWKGWEDDLYSFPQECAQYSNHDFIIRNSLYSIAYKVAIAYRERGVFRAFGAFVRGVVRRVDSSGAVMSKEDYVSISTPEKIALNELAIILNLPDKKIP